MTWDVLIGTHPPAEGFTQGDHDTFHQNFAGQATGHGDPDKLWRMAKKIQEIAQKAMNVTNLLDLMKDTFRVHFGFNPEGNNDLEGAQGSKGADQTS